MKRLLFIVFIFINPIFFCPSYAAVNIDSLKLVIKTASHDSIIIKSWKVWENAINKENPELSLTLNLKIDSLCNININKKSEELNRNYFINEKASCLNNIGLIYDDKGNYAKAIDYYTKNLEIAEKIKNKEVIAAALNNIGVLCAKQGDYDNAINYLTKSLGIKKKLGNKNAITNSFVNIGLIYKEQGNYSKAIDYCSKSLKVAEEIGNKKAKALSLNSIGIIYKEQGDYVKAIDYCNKSLTIAEEIENKEGIASSLYNIGETYLKQVNYIKAKNYSLRSLKIGEEIGVVEIIKNASNILWKVNRGLGNYKESLEMHELYAAMRDSIDSEKNQKEMIRQDFKYNYEKKTALDSLKALKEKRIAEAEYILSINQEKNMKLRIGLIATLLIILLILTSLFLLQKSKKEQQKLIIQLAEIKKKTRLPVNLKAVEFQLNKEKLEASINRKLNETDWSILKIITDHPEIKNEDIAQKIFKSKDGVSSSLRRMYQYFDISNSRYQKVSLALKVSKLSIKQAT